MGKKTPTTTTTPVAGSKNTAAGAASSTSSSISPVKASNSVPANKNASSSGGASTTAASIVASAAAASTTSSSPSPKQVTVKQIGEILMGDVEDDTVSYLVIDELERTQTFLRHRDTNYINMMDSNSQKSEKLRISILSSLRYNKQLVFDLMGNELLIDSLKRVCQELGPNIFNDLFNGSIKNETKFSPLIKPSDGDDFKVYMFSGKMNHFKVILMINKDVKSEDLLKLATPYKVIG